VTILPAGTTPPDPSQLLGSKVFVDLLRQLRERFDVVLLDAPPLLPVSDAAVLTTHSDGALLVSRYGHTRRDQVAAAADHLARVNGRLIGTVLNRVPPKEHSYRYGHDYGHGYRSAEGPAKQHRRRASDAQIPNPATDEHEAAKTS
jgi:Mrp family chromosome partitioning ATPase